ncbi:MAG: DUF2723 domain-containing protein [Bacteroidales bacterium]|nr:DUF2723 domain-containing protein [Bacteroidales bacterium]
MEKKYSLYNIILGWIVFFGATLVYFLTMEPTVSLWDCGEFIATASKLEVGHPPGAPLYLMLARFFALFAGNDVTMISFYVNLFTVVASGATIMFLFWTITHLAKKFFNNQELTIASIIVILGAGFIGASAYAFTDTFWFSAVEAEVYGLSSLFTAVVFWCILKWENDADKPWADKWIILIAFIMGLSIGVHLLNLLTITAIVYVYYFKKFPISPKGIIIAGLVSFVLIACMMWGVIVGSVELASYFELFFVNSIGMPFHSGLLIYILLLIAALVIGMIITHKDYAIKTQTAIVTLILVLVGVPFMASSPIMWILITAAIAGTIYYIAQKNKYVLNTIVNIAAVVMIGYSSYAMIIIRSNANLPMDENNPDNVFALLSYLNREQYGSNPLFYGQYYNAAPDWNDDGSANVIEKYTYTPRGNKYVKVNNGIEYIWANEFTTIFPRMYSREAHHVRAYKHWANIDEGKNTKRVIYDKERNSPSRGIYNVPTFSQNLAYFFNYQVGHMYVRYFMWNFVGRQNDEQSHGELTNGNWISGINAIDKLFVGDQTHISEKAKNHPARNTYYFLPLLLGLLGLAFHVKANKKDAFVVLLLFLMTGLAIIVFLNQTPYQPRERDYAYAGSFYAFSIWIGLGVMALYNLGKKYIKHPKVCAALACCVALPVPIILATENWDDHDRSGRYTAREFARNYMKTVDKNGMIVTAGDNDTFPLWYIQEAEEYGLDKRVICSPLLSTDWYSQQMMKRTYESAPLPTKLTPEQVCKGVRDVVRIQESSFTEGKYISLDQAMDVVRDDNMQTTFIGEKYNFIPARNLYFPVNKKQVLAQNIVSEADSGRIVSEIKFTITQNENDKSIYKNKLIMYDILDGFEWDRPLYFSNPVSAQELGLENYLRYDGFAYKFVPVYNKNINIPYSDTDVLYDNVMNKYEWGGMGDSTVYMCHFHQRTVRVIGVRSMFNQLAIQLGEENKKDSAVQVLTKLKSIMPDWQFPYFDDSIITTAYAYYMIDMQDEGNEELMIYVRNMIDELQWFNSLKPKFSKLVEAERQQYTQSILRIAEIAFGREDVKLQEQLEREWSSVEPTYSLSDILRSRQ